MLVSKLASTAPTPTIPPDLPTFDPSEMLVSSTSVVIGKRATGKTMLVRDLVARFPGATELLHFDGQPGGGAFDVKAVESLIRRQRIALRGGSHRTPVLVAVDSGPATRPLVTKHKCAMNIFLNGRFFKISMLLAASHCSEVHPLALANTDYVFVLRDPGRDPDSYKVLHSRLFRHHVPSFDDFCGLMDAATADHGCLVLDTVGGRLYRYKADPSYSARMPAA